MVLSIARATFIIAAFLVASGNSLAQSYPDRPIHFIVAFPPGGGADILGRLLGQQLSQALGQSVVVENRPGAAGDIGTDAVAKAAPDGYTVLGGPDTVFVINPTLYPNLPFHFEKDFSGVALVGSYSNILVIHPSVPAKSVKDLIALAKAKPGKLSWASSGVGSPTWHSGEVFQALAGIDVLHVPYKGGGPAVVDLLGGRVQFMFASIPSVLPYIKDGSLKALAVTAGKRVSLVPDVPTIAEAGLPGYESVTTFGVYVPKKTDPSIVIKLNAEIEKIVNMPSFKKKLSVLGVEPATSTPAELDKLIVALRAKWENLVKKAGIRAK